MSYSTILVHLDDGAHCARRIEVACRLALAHEAHLIGLAPTGVLQVPMQARVALGEAWLQDRA